MCTRMLFINTIVIINNIYVIYKHIYVQEQTRDCTAHWSREFDRVFSIDRNSLCIMVRSLVPYGEVYMISYVYNIIDYVI